MKEKEIDLFGQSYAVTGLKDAVGDMSTIAGVKLKYSKTDLPFLAVWKHFQKRSYVNGIEPGT